MSEARRPRVIVTRPAAQADAWVDRLQARGIAAVALPLIAIAPAADAAPVTAAWHALGARRLVVFVSPNAVLHFFAARPDDAVWPADLVAAAPGPGTSDALRERGVAASAIVEPTAGSRPLDSEALWLRLRERDWAGASVLVVRGDGGREWLGEQLLQAAATVDTVTAYRRLVPAFSAPERDLLDAAAKAPQDFLWLFSSGEAVANLLQVAPRDWRPARAIATHPRIAERARSAGFGHVLEAGASVDAIVACIQSIGP